jgi:Icc-related predicted phosphoesterase
LKLLLFSDLHANTTAAQLLLARAATVDIVIGAGDFATVRRNLAQSIDILRAITHPTILVAGNNETTDELRAACAGWPSAHILHGSALSIGSLTFYGIGGGIPITPFGAWSYDFSEEQAQQLLADCPAGCILVSHSPPHGAVDRSSQGKHLGSVAVRNAIVHARPQLVVCGHIHASAGQHTLIGSTPVINAGSTGVEWQLEQVVESS